jgi:diguanylate cyclase (GGDEF)-like protein
MTTSESRNFNYTQPLLEKDIQGTAIPSFLLPILTYFLPKEIRHVPKSNHVETFVGVKDPFVMLLLFISLLTLILTAGICVIMFIAAQTVFHEVCVGIVYVGSNLILIGGLYIFRRGGYSYLFLANIYTTSAFINIWGTNLLMGFTWTSPYLPMLIFIPLWAFTACDVKSGLRWALATIGAILLMFLVTSFEFEFSQIVPEWMMNFAYFLSWTSMAALVVLCLYIFRNNYETLSLHLNKERAHFAQQAVHDPLTGLANRTLFHDRADEALNFVRVENTLAVVIFIDLDDFKLVNDIHGHQAGDEVLKLVAQRVRGVVRAVDTVARLGGDEFGLILHGIGDRAVVGNISKKVSDIFLEPMVGGGIKIPISGSIGVAISPDDGSDIDTLMRHADSSMYRAKGQG